MALDLGRDVIMRKVGGHWPTCAPATARATIALDEQRPLAYGGAYPPEPHGKPSDDR